MSDNRLLLCPQPSGREDRLEVWKCECRTSAAFSRLTDRGRASANYSVSSAEIAVVSREKSSANGHRLLSLSHTLHSESHPPTDSSASNVHAAVCMYPQTAAAAAAAHTITAITPNEQTLRWAAQSLPTSVSGDVSRGISTHQTGIVSPASPASSAVTVCPRFTQVRSVMGTHLGNICDGDCTGRPCINQSLWDIVQDLQHNRATLLQAAWLLYHHHAALRVEKTTVHRLERLWQRLPVQSCHSCAQVVTENDWMYCERCVNVIHCHPNCTTLHSNAHGPVALCRSCSIRCNVLNRVSNEVSLALRDVRVASVQGGTQGTSSQTQIQPVRRTDAFVQTDTSHIRHEVSTSSLSYNPLGIWDSPGSETWLPRDSIRDVLHNALHQTQ